MSRVVEVAPERLERWLEGFARRDDGAARFDIVAREEFPNDPLGLVLVRRGGYAVGLARAGQLVAHKTGTRYVQSRTAAGGQSQQRFARRRGNQADELVRAVADHALRNLPPGVPAGLVVGGDRALVRDVLADSRLSHLARLPRREFYDLPDPRLDVLEEALRRGRAVRITLAERAEQP